MVHVLGDFVFLPLLRMPVEERAGERRFPSRCVFMGRVMSLAGAAPMLASNNFRKSPHRFAGVHLAIAIREQPAYSDC
jgi:hypothetical protein